MTIFQLKIMQNFGTLQYNQRFYYDEKWKEGTLLVKSNFQTMTVFQMNFL